MKSKLVIAAAVALAASPVLAAPRHRAPVGNQPMNAYGAASSAQSYANRGDVVMFGNRVVGEDPDPNIRTQMLHDPVVSEY